MSAHVAGCICLACELTVAERKAWYSLGRYKFNMFVYWAAIWVHLNRIGGFRKPNPWKALVLSARAANESAGLRSQGNSQEDA